MRRVERCKWIPTRSRWRCIRIRVKRTRTTMEIRQSKAKKRICICFDNQYAGANWIAKSRHRGPKNRHRGLQRWMSPKPRYFPCWREEHINSSSISLHYRHFPHINHIACSTSIAFLAISGRTMDSRYLEFGPRDWLIASSKKLKALSSDSLDSGSPHQLPSSDPLFLRSEYFFVIQLGPFSHSWRGSNNPS